MTLADAGSATQNAFMSWISHQPGNVIFLFFIAISLGGMIMQLDLRKSGNKIFGVIAVIVFILIILYQSNQSPGK